MRDFQDGLYRAVLFFLAIATIFSVDKVIGTLFYFLNIPDCCAYLMNRRLVLSSILFSITIILILLCIIYTLIYARNKLAISFRVPYFLIAIIFVTIPLFVSLNLINTFDNYSLNDSPLREKGIYLESILPNSMKFLNLCFIFLTLFVLEVFHVEKQYNDEGLSKQSFALLIFYGTGFIFTNTIDGLLYYSKELSTIINLLFTFSIISCIVCILYLFLAVAFELKVKIQIGGKS